MSYVNAAAAAAGTANQYRTNTVERQQFSKDLFLQLLVTQLRYQNPFSAEQDTGDMITQLTMFSLVEQVLGLQETLERYVSQSEAERSLNLLNRVVELEDGSGEVVRGTVTAVRFEAGRPYLTVNDQEYSFSAVIKVEGGAESDGA